MTLRLRSHATTLRLTPTPRSPVLAPARLPLASALPIRRTSPQIANGSTLFPSQPSRLVRRTPNLSAQDQPSPHHIGQHQKRKTPLLYVARVALRPWPSFLEAWTSSRFRKSSTGYGFAQVDSYALVFSFVLDVPLSILQLSPFALGPTDELVASFRIPRRPRDRHRARDRHSVNFRGFGLHIRRRAPVAGRALFEFVALSFPFQLTFWRRVLVSP